MVLLHQPRQSLRLLDVVQVSPLQILHQRQKPCVLVVRRYQQTRHLPQPGKTRRAQPPLARDQLKAAALFAHRERLQHAILPDGGGKLLQTCRVKNASGLRRIWANGTERQKENPSGLQNGRTGRFLCEHDAPPRGFSASSLQSIRRKNARNRCEAQEIEAKQVRGTKCGESCG